MLFMFVLICFVWSFRLVRSGHFMLCQVASCCVLFCCVLSFVESNRVDLMWDGVRLVSLGSLMFP
jgi:hypothetical protein